MLRPRGDRPLGGGVVLGGRDGDDGVAVAVGQVEHAGGYLRPGLDGAGPRQVVDAVRRGRARLDVALAVAEQPEDALGHVAGEGEPSALVVDHGDAIEGVRRVRHPVGEGPHRPDEVAALADHPGAAHDVVPGAAGHGEVAGGLGLAVDGQRREGLVLGMHLGGAVEDVVGGHVDERHAMLGAGAGEERRPGRVGPPGGGAALGGLGPVHGRVGAAVDHGAVERPVVLAVGRRVGHVEGVYVAEVEPGVEPALLGERAHRPAQLAVAAGDERPLGRHRDDVGEMRVVEVGLGDGRLPQRDGPLDGELGVGEVHEGVGLLQL